MLIFLCLIKRTYNLPAGNYYLMDRIYLIAHTNRFQLSRSFIEQYGHQVTPIIINEYVIENQLTSTIVQHLDQLQALTKEQFDWSYYVAKYDHHLNQSDAWQHWCEIGQLRGHNPINMCSIQSRDEIPIIQCLLQILVDAIDRNYQTIVIIDQPMNTQSPTSYVITRDTYLPLLIEASYFISKFDELLKPYINTGTYIPTGRNMERFTLNQPLDISEDSTPIIQLREQYLHEQYVVFLETHHVNISDRAKMDYILQQYPYDLINQCGIVIYN